MFKFFVLAVIAIASADAFWVPCSDHPGNAPSHVESPSCLNFCTFPRGENLFVDATHTFPAAHTRLDVRVTAFIFGLPSIVPQNPPDDDACNSLSPYGCPTVHNTTQIWRINFLIPISTYPRYSNTRVRCKFIWIEIFWDLLFERIFQRKSAIV